MPADVEQGTYPQLPARSGHPLANEQIRSTSGGHRGLPGPFIWQAGCGMSSIPLAPHQVMKASYPAPPRSPRCCHPMGLLVACPSCGASSAQPCHSPASLLPPGPPSMVMVLTEDEQHVPGLSADVELRCSLAPVLRASRVVSSRPAAPDKGYYSLAFQDKQGGKRRVFQAEGMVYAKAQV